jgi:hypothetical protein
MTHSDRTQTQLATAALGLSCFASALLFERTPRAAADIVQLPANPRLGRSIAGRDFAVGVLLVTPATQRTGLALRAASDALDVGIMASEVLRGRRSLAAASLPMLGGLALCALALGLRARLA